ncbi:BNR repeat-containing protein [Echinicola jeungdonensis]|uniref:BNR repeat-containing protein n=1 Tax=Echinicola jeungdonensis TaxID=709343 RepID=A0ABV5J356_9BACT|nr:BNR repeat-containing protein [Echinicola jeungdonensis]MDN3668486.1 BNR repeat-containing protein [Echinicola jeungdonensis]
MNVKKIWVQMGLILALGACKAQMLQDSQVRETYVGEGWGNNSVNTVIFRRNALTTFEDTQFTAYYDPSGHVVLAKRELGDEHWETHQTKYTGNVKDAHNTISIAVDGAGYLHVSWDHHDNPLRYAKSKAPLGLELGPKEPMTGVEEEKVTYPEFHALPNGDLLFFYRSGASGQGNLVMNRYDVEQQSWIQLHDKLIDGEGQRNAYWQAFVDKAGTVHLSWVWRETWDVSTNHDLAYARSTDGGQSWERSNGDKYQLPITNSTAEYAWNIPQKSNLINQTAMYADENSQPYIVTYWEENGVTQYQVVYQDGQEWKKANTGFRNTSFQLGGGGTKRIPISRPQILVEENGSDKSLFILFRDEERGNKVSLAYTSALEDNGFWEVMDLTQYGVGQWEPNYDIELWKEKKQLHVFVQEVQQVDSEGLAQEMNTAVKVIELNP